MKAGILRHRITIQALTPTQDGTTGAITEAWTTFASVRAAVAPLSAKEYANADSQLAKTTLRVTIRYIPGILPSMRILHLDKTYRINAVLVDAETGKEHITLPCEELTYG